MRTTRTNKLAAFEASGKRGIKPRSSSRRSSGLRLHVVSTEGMVVPGRPGSILTSTARVGDGVGMGHEHAMSPAGLRAWVLASVLAALATIALKVAAYLVTGSVGLLSDALESGINLFAAVAAYLSLRYSHRPADATHAYGHEKIEFMSAGLEGLLVVLAGISTVGIGINRLIHPVEIRSLGLGTLLALTASLINLGVGAALVRIGRREHSIVLEADGRHLLADVWTSAAVVAGIAVVWATGFLMLDALVAIAVGTHILAMGLRLVKRSFDGLMDHALTPEEQERVRAAIRRRLPPGTTFHALRTRRAGQRKFADFHLLVPGTTSVREAHDLSLQLESGIKAELNHIEVAIHIEPIEDRASWDDHALAEIEPTHIPMPSDPHPPTG